MLEKKLQVAKIGTGSHLDEQGEVRREILEQKVEEILKLELDHGLYTILVVSGAIAFGKLEVGETRRNDQLTPRELQRYASIGQPILIDLYRELFGSKYISQVLVTEDSLKPRKHVRDLIAENLEDDTITVVNYNDTVDWNQIRKDNDTLAAQILRYVDADRLILLGFGYEGVEVEGRLIEVVSDVKSIEKYCTNETTEHGNGGMQAKVDAAYMVTRYGKPMIIGNVEYPLEDLIDGSAPSTLFEPLPMYDLRVVYNRGFDTMHRALSSLREAA